MKRWTTKAAQEQAEASTGKQKQDKPSKSNTKQAGPIQSKQKHKHSNRKQPTATQSNQEQPEATLVKHKQDKTSKSKTACQVNGTEDLRPIESRAAVPEKPDGRANGRIREHFNYNQTKRAFREKAAPEGAEKEKQTGR
ncbi:hypothetical protein GCM10007389_12710 [Pontibacter akesuensis]|nr:hypothetical protein GCM10007389_12710 [Pontibacter akesuensis]